MQSKLGKYTIEFISDPYSIADDFKGKVFESFHRIPKEGWTQDLAGDFATDRIQEWYGENDWRFDSEDNGDSFKVLLKTLDDEPKEFIIDVQVDVEYTRNYFVYANKDKA